MCPLFLDGVSWLCPAYSSPSAIAFALSPSLLKVIRVFAAILNLFNYYPATCCPRVYYLFSIVPIMLLDWGLFISMSNISSLPILTFPSRMIYMEDSSRLSFCPGFRCTKVMRDDISFTLFKRSYFAISVLLKSNLLSVSCNLFYPLTVILSFLSINSASIHPLKN